MQKIAQETGGFLYLVTKAGTTGEGGLDYEAIRKHAAEVKAVSSLPVCLGFGIRNGADAHNSRPWPTASSSAPPSATSSAKPPAPDLPARMAEKIRDLRQGLDAK